MDNRQKIIIKALSLFASRGYDAVGVQEISIACRITKPTLYHYFTNKRGLLEAILAIYYPLFLKEIKRATDYHHDLVMNLRALADIFFEFAQKESEFNRFSLAADFSPPESEAHIAHKQYLEAFRDTIEAMFLLAVVDHGNMRNKQRQLAISFVGLLRGYIGMYLSGEIVLDEAIGKAVVKQYMHGIFS